MPETFGPRYSDQVEALLDARPPVFSFVFGIPSQQILDECRKRNIKTLGAATTVDEAVALENAGVDTVVATGFEAGGHRVSFLRPAEKSLTGIFSLIPQVADKIKIPFIAAGGIVDGRGIAAALILGAGGVQIGSAFLACKESNASELHRKAIFSDQSKYTTLTKVFSGRWSRGISSRLSEEMEKFENDIAPFPMQGLFLRPLREKIIASGSSDVFSFWAGQSAPLIRHTDAKELFNSLIKETGEKMKNVSIP
jgi:nitronate monooxygenase